MERGFPHVRLPLILKKAISSVSLVSEVPREKDFTIKLYRKGFIGWNSLLGRFTGRFLESELDGG